MAPTKHNDIQVVSIMCHILNRTPGERYQNLIYCVPPKLLQRMFEKYEHKWLDDKKKPQDFRTLLNHKKFLSYLDKDRLQSHRFLSNSSSAINMSYIFRFVCSHVFPVRVCINFGMLFFNNVALCSHTLCLPLVAFCSGRGEKTPLCPRLKKRGVPFA
ncbi:hypothetical protein PIB30_026135 [Stylosanthes scabra]|uniref:Uncharacterized protein n=1 Tax=Stylosanthes scabra TaxID=79078 RepID=A0ABU6UA50_9FABA|nr:hypothetical protein [Stylosanthes scabra]